MGRRIRQWVEKRRRKAKVIYVIKAVVQQKTKTTEMQGGLYHTELQCPCSRVHVLVHYEPALNLEKA